ncbi:siderophore-interacting protein [Streptosporangium subroseum]|uniref:siderophore-interacting protein n=1 Tax=Streptosporangium subroseum TaxID=106412 RepID=UPI00342BE2E9
MASHNKPLKPAEQEFLRATVIRSIQISPNVVRVTIGGNELRRFRPVGFDQWFRLFITREGQETLHLSMTTGLTGYRQLLSMPMSTQPIMRNYSVRAFRPAALELDIDFVLHDGGVASSWAGRVEHGRPVAILDEGINYAPATPPAWTLLVADESGLPAIAGVLASLGPGTRGAAYIEVPGAADIQPVTAPDGVTVHWLTRDDPHAMPGVLSLSTVMNVELPVEPDYSFLVGESSLVTGLRRHLVKKRNISKSAISFCGYWRHPDTPAENDDSLET